MKGTIIVASHIFYQQELEVTAREKSKYIIKLEVTRSYKREILRWQTEVPDLR